MSEQGKPICAECKHSFEADGWRCRAWPMVSGATNYVTGEVSREEYDRCHWINGMGQCDRFEHKVVVFKHHKPTFWWRRWFSWPQ